MLCLEKDKIEVMSRREGKRYMIFFKFKKYGTSGKKKEKKGEEQEKRARSKRKRKEQKGITDRYIYISIYTKEDKIYWRTGVNIRGRLARILYGLRLRP